MKSNPPLRAAAALCLLYGIASAQDFSKARALIEAQIKGGRAPSIAVAVARKGTIMWQQGFGWADREHKIAATSDTLYSVASITKPFTATGLMTLVQAGKIDLDAPVNRYLRRARIRAMVGDANDATVRRVANHTSGLPVHGDFFYVDEKYRPPSIEETIRRYGILVTPPGEHWEYSNLGYGILGHVIELVSGKPYADFMEDQVFQPLGLDHSSVGIRPVPGRVYAVRYGMDDEPIPYYTTDHPGASAIWASVHDLVTFGMFQVKVHLATQKPILTDASIDEMQTPGTGAAAHYGVGWNLAEAKGYKIVLHGGDMEGVTSLLLLIPSEQLVVAAICNVRADIPSPVIDEILEALLLGWRDRAPPAMPPAPRRMPQAFIGAWSGTITTYAGGERFVMTVDKSGAARARIGAQPQQTVHNISFDGKYLTGTFPGFIDTPDASRHPHNVSILLALRNGKLEGAATAFSQPPGGWLGNALTSWAELRKQR